MAFPDGSSDTTPTDIEQEFPPEPSEADPSELILQFRSQLNLTDKSTMIGEKVIEKFFQPVEEAFGAGSLEYAEFLKLMFDFVDKRADIQVVRSRIRLLLKEHPQLVSSFDTFFPNEVQAQNDRPLIQAAVDAESMAYMHDEGCSKAFSDIVYGHQSTNNDIHELLSVDKVFKGEKPQLWSNLMADLLLGVGGRIEAWDDRYRVRLVCKSWRSSILPLSRCPWSLPTRIPYPIHANSTLDSAELGGYFLLNRTTIYRLQRLQRYNQAWLVKLAENNESDSPRRLNPLSNVEMSHPIKVRLSHIGVSVVSDAYSLTFKHLTHESTTALFVDQPVDIERTILFDEPGGGRNLAVVENDGDLAVFSIEMGRWILHQKRGSLFEDILNFKGQVYAVDDRGKCIIVETLDSSLNVTEVASPLNVDYSPYWRSLSRKKYLVESSGELLLLDEYRHAYSDEIDSDIVTGVVYARTKGVICEVPTFFVVYKLDKSERKWVWIDNLQDKVILVSSDCSFSVSTNDFDGWPCEGNMIFFTDESWEHAERSECSLDQLRGREHYLNPMCFKLEDGSVRSLLDLPGYCNVIWPPPIWLQDPEDG